MKLDWRDSVFIGFLRVLSFTTSVYPLCRERKHSSTSSHQLHVDGISSSHSHVRKAQDKENRGRGQPSSKNHSKTTLVSSSSKWNRRLPSTSSNGSGSAFVKPVKLHHGNGMPIGGGGLLRSREPTTAVA